MQPSGRRWWTLWDAVVLASSPSVSRLSFLFSVFLSLSLFSFSSISPSANVPLKCCLLLSQVTCAGGGLVRRLQQTAESFSRWDFLRRLQHSAEQLSTLMRPIHQHQHWRKRDWSWLENSKSLKAKGWVQQTGRWGKRKAALASDRASKVLR